MTKWFFAVILDTKLGLEAKKLRIVEDNLRREGSVLAVEVCKKLQAAHPQVGHCPILFCDPARRKRTADVISAAQIMASVGTPAQV